MSKHQNIFFTDFARQLIYPTKGTFHSAILILLVTVLICTTGCLSRTITITSEPTGALVHLNDQEIGRTPITTNFTFYGDYDVRLSHESAQPLWTNHQAKTPFWDYPGLDLIAEAIPYRRTYNIDWHFELSPYPNSDSERLLNDAMRFRMDSETSQSFNKNF